MRLPDPKQNLLVGWPLFGRANCHARELALRPSWLVSAGWFCLGGECLEADDGRNEIGLAIDQVCKLFKDGQANLAYLPRGEACLTRNNVNKFF